MSSEQPAAKETAAASAKAIGLASSAGAAPGRFAATCPIALSDLSPGAPGRVTGLSLVASAVRPGDLYVALPGTRTHGARFAAAAAAAGAAAVLTDTAGAALAGPLGLPVVVAAEPRTVLADLAARLFGRPGDRLVLLAVTGTNGKTTTVFCADAILGGLGLDTATLGTMGLRRRGRPLPWASTTITTPEAPDLQAALALLAADGCQAVALEVSSHALALHRADALVFAAAGFTNLGADHLDFHGDKAAYFEAKARLFEPNRAKTAVVHTDDQAGRRLAERLAGRGQDLVTVGRGPGPGFGRTHCQITAEAPSGDGTTAVELRADGFFDRFCLGLPGRHNVTDAAVAVCLVRAAGFDPAPGLGALAEVRVPGRLERVRLDGAAPQVYVDFAHTPEAIAEALAAVGALAAADDGKVVAVIGGGGDRDPSKRGPMGAAAAGAADAVIVTDDNPRFEQPALIRAAVLAGGQAARAAAPSGSRAARADVIDGGPRRAAIALALAYAGPGDVVAVLGKGHETTQEAEGRFSPFEDRAEIAAAWAARGKA
ncbi:MAG: UDP-N-acetylmuramoyl-L-alanyl-D-glutamate--2,6-diaminopimelate ligase [Propionibacteriaceae bacterium]|nr:UDP-N-acetylmuramoyl-L-alanyl-D-glutamate--2,6-diaminopimelate ligase [Propionibacteriaceae bacterium]